MAVSGFYGYIGYANAASYKTKHQIQCLADIFRFAFDKKAIAVYHPFSITNILRGFIEICMEGNLLFNVSFSYINIFTCFL